MTTFTCSYRSAGLRGTDDSTGRFDPCSPTGATVRSVAASNNRLSKEAAMVGLGRRTGGRSGSMILRMSLVILIFLLGSQSAPADTIYLQDGRQIVGKITSVDGAPHVIIDTPMGSLEFPASNVEKIVKGDVQPPASQPETPMQARVTGPPPSPEKIAALRKAAEAGDARAMLALGSINFFGHGVAKDNVEAAKWYRKAAEAGQTAAMNNLGLLYDRGLGVSKDATEAVNWFRKAAEAGDATAMNNLGVAYARGRGVVRDDTEAVRWYRMAAEGGNATGMDNLGAMYAAGRGVPKNQSEAAKWQRMARETKNAAAATVATAQPPTVPGRVGSTPNTSEPSPMEKLAGKQTNDTGQPPPIATGSPASPAPTPQATQPETPEQKHQHVEQLLALLQEYRESYTDTINIAKGLTQKGEKRIELLNAVKRLESQCQKMQQLVGDHPNVHPMAPSAVENLSKATACLKRFFERKISLVLQGETDEDAECLLSGRMAVTYVEKAAALFEQIQSVSAEKKNPDSKEESSRRSSTPIPLGSDEAKLLLSIVGEDLAQSKINTLVANFEFAAGMTKMSQAQMFAFVKRACDDAQRQGLPRYLGAYTAIESIRNAAVIDGIREHRP